MKISLELFVFLFLFNRQLEMKTLEASGLVHGGHPCIHLFLQQLLRTYRYNINVLSFVRILVTVNP